MLRNPRRRAKRRTERGYYGEKPSSKYKRSNSWVVKIEGTRGYMAPKFQTTGIPTQKSDVFAFGVVLLELLSGAEPLKYMVDRERGDYKRISMIETATEAVAMESGTDGEGRIWRWIDKRLKDSFPVDVLEKITRIAVDCIQVEPNKRPDMNIVSGKISKLYLDSKTWSEKMKIPTDITFYWLLNNHSRLLVH
uniref:Protein kinase domain-containing protein n=1 Tax=Nelumbo nucifera TaxID=4432 RepID=A0A822ZJ36_NELNU|nr:TPA_asm: hypothetical protein HUJ06_001629 [Nelumbo nucifera]